MDLRIDIYSGKNKEVEYVNFTKGEIIMDKIGSAMLNIVVWTIGFGSVLFFLQHVSGGAVIGAEQAYIELINLFN